MHTNTPKRSVLMMTAVLVLCVWSPSYSRAQTSPVLVPILRVKTKPIPYLDLVQKHALSVGLPVAFVLSVIQTESAFNPKAVSHAGAQGLMQLMPSVQKDYGVLNPFDPEQNIKGGCALLARLKTRYKGDVNKMLAAYNAGPGHVRDKGGIPWAKTRKYVKKIVMRWSRWEKRLQSPTTSNVKWVHSKESKASRDPWSRARNHYESQPRSIIGVTP